MIFCSNIEKCKYFVQQLDLGLRWDSTPRVSRPERQIHPPGQTSQFYPPGIIMSSRVLYPCGNVACNPWAFPKVILQRRRTYNPKKVTYMIVEAYFHQQAFPIRSNIDYKRSF